MSEIYPLFRHRTEAGQKLAQAISAMNISRGIVLSVPRGGVPVGYEIARSLALPLDTIVVRKIGVPGNPEFGIGAVAPGDVWIFNLELMDALGVQERDVQAIIQSEIKEMGRRMVRYKSGMYAPADRDTVTIVDDGVATGISAQAAIESVKLLYDPSSIVFATPICQSDVAKRLSAIVDTFVCLYTVDYLSSVGQYYEHFDPVPDEEVVFLLNSVHSSP